MNSDVKNTISHRYKALQALRDHLVKVDGPEHTEPLTEVNVQRPPDAKKAKQSTES
jgi:hypothetical protein